MAVTTAGRSLTEQHRRTQLALRALVARDVLRIYPALNLADLDRTWSPVLTALTNLILARRGDSATLAAGYYQAFRLAEQVGGSATPIRVADIDVDALASSLGYAGPATAQRLVRIRPADLDRQIQASLIATTSRHVLNAGRDTLLASTDADPRALGWARVTSGAPCHFCAMIAGRGPVFTARTVRFQAHDHCACTAEPMYRRDQPWPGKAQEFKSLWSETTQGLSGRDARNAFRRAIEGR